MDSKQYYPRADINPAITDTSGSFDPQLPLGREAGTRLHTSEGELIPPGIMMLEGGRMRLRYTAGPDVTRVTVYVNNVEHELQRVSPTLFSVDVDGGEGGFRWVEFHVDGAEVINPMAPIGFGASRPTNFADIPRPDGDFYALKDVPHGAVAQEYYYSKSTNSWKSCLVYTPPGYMKDDKTAYPVLYLQHGHGENEQCWVHQGRVNFILDNLIAQGKAVPFIVVMNNGMVQTVQDGARVLDEEMITPLLLEDCIPYIEKTYRVLTDKWHRAMAGLSMGSMQTSRVVLSHPCMFSYAGVFSGFVTPFRPLKRGTDYLRTLDDKEAFARDIKLFFRACGTSDFLALERFHADSDMFRQKGLAPEDCPAHEIMLYPGDHEWNVWRMCIRDFAQRIFKAQP